MKIDDKLLTKNQRWIRSNKLVALSTLLIKDSYCEWVFIDGTHIKVHQHRIHKSLGYRLPRQVWFDFYRHAA